MQTGSFLSESRTNSAAGAAYILLLTCLLILCTGAPTSSFVACGLAYKPSFAGSSAARPHQCSSNSASSYRAKWHQHPLLQCSMHCACFCVRVFWTLLSICIYLHAAALLLMLRLFVAASWPPRLACECTLLLVLHA